MERKFFANKRYQVELSSKDYLLMEAKLFYRMHYQLILKRFEYEMFSVYLTENRNYNTHFLNTLFHVSLLLSNFRISLHEK